MQLEACHLVHPMFAGIFAVFPSAGPVSGTELNQPAWCMNSGGNVSSGGGYSNLASICQGCSVGHLSGTAFHQKGGFLQTYPLVHTISVSHGQRGRVVPDKRVRVAQGSNVVFVMTADDYYHLSSVLTNGGAVAGLGGTASTQYVWSNVVHDGEMAASFAPDLAASNTPVWWLAFHSLTNLDWDTEALRDVDGDGMAAWEEWWSDTLPRNASSVFRIERISTPAGDRVPVTFACSTSCAYRVWSAADLQSAVWGHARYSEEPAGTWLTSPVTGTA